VGVFGTLLDVASFWAFIRLGWSPWLAVTAAYALATAAQFYLNRRYCFQAFDRYVLHQLGTYSLVTFAQWLLTVAIVELGIRAFRFDPLLAKIISIPPGAIAGFVGNRYLTFGPGLRAAVARMRGKESR